MFWKRQRGTVSDFIYIECEREHNHQEQFSGGCEVLRGALAFLQSKKLEEAHREEVKNMGGVVAEDVP